MEEKLMQETWKKKLRHLTLKFFLNIISKKSKTRKMGLSFTKLFTRLFAKNEMCILMVGLDAVSKTTIFYKLKLGEIVTTIPVIDLMLRLWNTRTLASLFGIFGQDKDELRDAVLLVFANKQDLPCNECCQDNRQAWSSFSPSTSLVHPEHMQGLDWLSNNIANKRCSKLVTGDNC